MLRRVAGVVAVDSALEAIMIAERAAVPRSLKRPEDLAIYDSRCYRRRCFLTRSAVASGPMGEDRRMKDKQKKAGQACAHVERLTGLSTQEQV